MTEPTIVNSRDDAAAVLISVNSFAAWDQVADALQPNFKIDANEALLQVAPTTLHIQQQALRAFGFTAGVGLPQSFSESTATQGLTSTQVTTTANGTSTALGETNDTTSSTRTDTRNPGVAPTPPTGIPGGGSLPATVTITGDIGIDPVLKYQAALSLYQAVQLMNKQVQHMATIGCYVPYMVHTKIALMPYRRNLPYDLHARVAFFGSPAQSRGQSAAGEDAVPLATPAQASAAGRHNKGKCANNDALPRVVPMLVTDDVERAMKSRAVETARQLSLAVSAMVNGIGGNLGANAASQDVGVITGSDINSRLTVGRQTGNTVYARIGAANQATAGIGMLGQTYDIYLVLLVPESYFEHAADSGVEIDVHSYTEFRNGLNGQTLPKRSDARFLNDLHNAATDVLSGAALRRWNARDADLRESDLRELAGHIQMSKWPSFERKLTDLNLGISEGYQRALWTRLGVVFTDSPFKAASFELPLPAPIRIAKQDVILVDDGKDKALVRLGNASGLTARLVNASIALSSEKEPKNLELPARAIGYDSVNRVLTLEFPSVSKFLGEKKNGRVTLALRCPPQGLCPRFEGQSTYPVLFTPAAAAEPSAPQFELVSALKQIVVRNNSGTVSVFIDKLKDPLVELRVANAEVVGVTDQSGKALALSSTHTVSVRQNTALTFRLAGIQRNQIVTIEAEGKAGDKSTGKKSLAFPVI